jgi:hypothetical protein
MSAIWFLAGETSVVAVAPELTKAILSVSVHAIVMWSR